MLTSSVVIQEIQAGKTNVHDIVKSLQSKGLIVSYYRVKKIVKQLAENSVIEIDANNNITIVG